MCCLPLNRLSISGGGVNTMDRFARQALERHFLVVCCLFFPLPKLALAGWSALKMKCSSVIWRRVHRLQSTGCSVIFNNWPAMSSFSLPWRVPPCINIITNGLYLAGVKHTNCWEQSQPPVFSPNSTWPYDQDLQTKLLLYWFFVVVCF